MRSAHAQRGALVLPSLALGILAMPAAAAAAEGAEAPLPAEGGASADSAEVQELFIEGRDFDHICEGFDEEWGVCEGLPACGPCVPTNCIWGQWEEWHYAGGCIGLNLRERHIEVRANECGRPCEGAQEESKSFILDKCKPHGADCKLSAWSTWSVCKEEKDQSMRQRDVEQKPGTGGKPCLGSLQETRPCGGPKKTDCKFGEWQDWTSCSATCGEGRHTRMRRVEQEAANGGHTCWDSLLQTDKCASEACPGQDCELSEWSDWSDCNHGRTQRFRNRQVLQAPKGSGKVCEQELMETLGCPQPEPEDCEVSEWGEWSQCDKSCGGGQHYRERRIERPAAHGGDCSLVSLKDTEECGTAACNTEGPRDCELTEWESWSTCTATCGGGSTTRERRIKSFATFGGSGCQGALAELGECNSEACAAADCAWSDWEEWSPCSSSCGGGIKHRARQISVSPSSGGAACDARDKGEVLPCNVEPCGKGCIDGVWGEWQAWSECSGTCQTAYKSRRRNVDVHPNFCGKAPIGLREEFKQCKSLPTCSQKRDCQLSEWGEWSECSTKCFGIRERNRFIVEFAVGGGKSCNHGLKQIEPCNPVRGGETPVSCADKAREDCVMDQWTSWSHCSATCGGGQKTRRRSMLAPAQNGGRPCSSDLVVTAPCGTESCPNVDGCQDCVWGEWAEWSACSKCGGQKYRHRAIETMPNRCGRRCDMKTAKEVTECADNCETARFCAWTEWSAAECSQRCGNATAMRSRTLGLFKKQKDYLFVAPDDGQCAGTQLNHSLCPYAGPCKPCTAVDCELGAWSEWTSPSCQGLCERNRVVVRMNNQCGQPCGGSLLETKRCTTGPCDTPKDCIVSDWDDWTRCQKGVAGGQRYRSREITQPPSHGGTPCRGVLSETVGCDAHGPQTCHFGAWAEWSACSLTCGIGWHVRSRQVAQPTRRGGVPCRGNLKELKHCEYVACDRRGTLDCEFSDWGDWTHCAGDGQRFRDRKISRPATIGGENCEGGMHETETCVLQKVDCRVSDWTEWDQCDRACGKGQSHRQRQIHRFPENGGETCPHELMQTHGCELKPCVVKNCTVSTWSDWGPCQEQCGPGMQRRSRTIEQLRDPGGRGFTGMLGEARECLDNPECETSDCAWHDWEAWTPCSSSCGGGQKQRHRRIKTYPRKGGKSCEAKDLAEVERCNTQPCGEARCEDGTWADWNDWAPCSASCDGGTTFRTRQIFKMANECGCPPHGKDRQTAFCNVNTPCGETVDCEFSMWTEWEACSATCDGVKRRHRQVETYGRGNGAYCTGALRQTWPCNPSPGEELPKGCVDGPRTDCVLNEWSEWSLCSASCGGGEHIRSRSIKRHPTNGGKACNDALAEIKECGRSACAGPSPTDCKFGEWEEWGECDKCSGERTRFRSILAFPINGGKECEPTSTREVGKCPRRCHHQRFCEWHPWGPWTDCSVTCGQGGKRRRIRKLHLADFAAAKIESTMQGFESLRARAELLEAHHTKEVLASFAAGCAAVLAVLGGIRGLSAARRRGPPGYAGLSDPRLQGLAGSAAPGGVYQHLRLGGPPHASVDLEVE